ncbi:PspA/IM30 family protein [Brachybacterium huguangmaarense]|uniref:PspA/IM30 family protein n=1 Tax=Brachybacterium huguangmaarense TaxID=1652028 RepID=A0ABY6FYY2_9MICO|nr:PspA/IM30 family protein [Brachybacterium huguangmaarense]UYG16107.1 PspA/IM30 family protein [Brachybacterium huguangmaarense]
MPKKQSILGRIAQLTRANINALLDQAEDPEKMLDQMIRDYTDSIREAEAAVSQTIGNLRLMERDQEEDRKAAEDWNRKALAASQRGDQLRAEGNGSEADRFDNLARVAIERQLQAEEEVQAVEPSIRSQNEVVGQLKTGLDTMRGKLTELRSKRDQLVARSRAADAQNRMSDAIGAIDVLDPTSELSRFEEKVRREEAKVIGRQEIAANSLDNQFESLEVEARRLDVDDRLAALKRGAGTEQVEGRRAMEGIEASRPAASADDETVDAEIDEEYVPGQSS